MGLDFNDYKVIEDGYIIDRIRKCKENMFEYRDKNNMYSYPAYTHPDFRSIEGYAEVL